MNECYEKEEVGELLSSWKGLIERGGVIGGNRLFSKLGSRGGTFQRRLDLPPKKTCYKEAVGYECSVTRFGKKLTYFGKIKIAIVNLWRVDLPSGKVFNILWQTIYALEHSFNVVPKW